jgi:hypothetical protein
MVTFASAVAVTVHLTDRERFSTLFSNVQLRGDGEWWEALLLSHSFEKLIKVVFSSCEFQPVL